MEVKDLPQFEGLPSPEMEAGNNGLYASTVGMLDQWKMFQNGDTIDTSTGIDYDSSGSDVGVGGGGGGGGGSDTGSTVFAMGKKQAGRSSAAAAPRATFIAPAGPAAAAAPAPVTAPPFLAPQAMPPPAAVPAPAPATARSYIISRPATGSVGAVYSAPAAAAVPRRTQQRTRQTLNYNVATAAAAATGQGPWLNATSSAEAQEAAVLAHQLESRHFNSSSYRARAAAAEAEAAGTAAAGGWSLDDNNSDGYDRPPLTSPTRRLFAAKQPGRHVCNKGTPTNSTTGPLGKSSFSGKVSNIVGITMADSGVVPADAAIAVGPNHVVHVVNGLVKILPVNSNGEFPKSLKPGQMRLIPLPDWFGLVASPCDGGYINPSATYDKEVGRFLISAICGGDTNQVVLSVSADSSATGSWILYSFAGEATQGTRMQCINESYPISFHSQVRGDGGAQGHMADNTTGAAYSACMLH
jgi:hypothetical protein